MEQRMKHLLQRLSFLGYSSFQVERMIHEAVGNKRLDTTCAAQRREIVRTLEKYERLGTHYLQTYSK